MKKRKKNKRRLLIRPDWKWITMTFGTTVGISATMSLASGELLSKGGMAVSFVVLLTIIMIGIVFDILGVAVTAAGEKSFHSMAAKKVPEAVVAIKLLRRAERVSSFCNDVVGDICGVISGSASAVIAARAVLQMEPDFAKIVQLLMSSLVAALTVGGKAFGKSIAMNNSEAIVHVAAKAIYGIQYFMKSFVTFFKRA